MIISFLIVAVKTLLSICFVLGSIALVHELGHYLTAKLTGIWVLEFAIGFGNRLVKIKWGETIYSIRPFPLGGFVRLAGMDTEEEEEKKEGEAEAGGNGEKAASSEPQKETEPEDPDDRLPQLAPDDPRGYPSKPRWAKVLVLSAGSIMNMVWAVVLFIVIYAVSGGPLTNIMVMDALKDQPAYMAGVRAGDTITAIDGVHLEDWSEGVRMIQLAGGREITLSVARDNPTPRPAFGGGVLAGDYAVNRGSYEEHRREEITVKVVPSGVEGSGRIGISLAPNNYDFRVLSFGKACKRGFEAAKNLTMQTVNGLYKMIVRETQADVAGPVKIMQMIKEQAHKGIFELLYLTAMLSINIGLINLMPLPVLDGGRIVFVLLEALFALLRALTGINLVITPKVEENIHFVGLLFLLTVLLLVTYQDIRSFF
ncbi:MAG TPA: M50 family metallopeptidase [Candidatus Ozemobacteraceae bacterium]|nr:M50 family metallopeptidase [Candidatus Ozemobacteraceae bacterium]